jgi:poly-gamma-glutamate synthesis protein (capsule biosynthesis protein)
VSLFLAGDVMTGRGIDQILPRSVDPVLYEPWVKSALTYVEIAQEAGAAVPESPGYEYVWGDALDELGVRAPDLRLVNLETAVTDHDEPWPGKGIHYRMHPGNVRVLTVAGLDGAILANNHVLDWGRPGLSETVETLRSAGVTPVGAGEDREAAEAPAVFDGAWGRVLVFAYGSPTAGVFPEWSAGPERAGVNVLLELGAAGAESVAAEVAAHRREGDRVVVSVHWGGNWGYEVPDEQQSFARRLIDFGAADLVFGHSSHHPKGMEIHGGRLILYGAGDFLNDYEGIGGHGEYRGELTLMYFPRLGSDGSLEALEMTPMRIQDFRLRRASAEERGWLAARLDRESRPFGASVVEDDAGALRLE